MHLVGEVSPLAALSPQRLDAVVPELAGEPLAEVKVSGLQSNSRLVESGEAFCAWPGLQVDGRDYIDEALTRGASAVLVDRAAPWREPSVYRGVPILPVQNLQARISDIAGRFYVGDRHAKGLVGITGTNGKTSTAHYICQILALLDERAATIGTLGYGVPGQLSATTHTTPDAISVQKIVADCLDKGFDYITMEVSSHALEQGRVAGLRFDTAVFTNLSHDHLDYHGTMAAYADSKRRLFRQQDLRYAIINHDDPWAEFFRTDLDRTIQCLSYSPGGAPAADIRVVQVDYSADGWCAEIQTPWGSAAINAKLLGDFNLSNVVASLAAVCVMGFPLAEVVTAISKLTPVPGRMEVVSNDAGIVPVIDYAHTPDALEKALRALRTHVEEELWCVFGCGGDRDRQKRPVMGRIAEQLADQLVVTSDNPRSEDPLEIIRQISSACSGDHVRQDADRRSAIIYAITHAARGDSILVAGKGHEDYQEVAGQRLPFSDRQVIEEALEIRRLAG